MKCPMCRMRVTLLMPGQLNTLPPDLDQKLQAFNRIYGSQPRSLRERLRDMPVLLRHLWRNFRQAPVQHIVSVGPKRR